MKGGIKGDWRLPEKEPEQQVTQQGDRGQSRLVDLYKAGEFVGCGFAMASVFQHSLVCRLKEIASMFTTTPSAFSPSTVPAKNNTGQD